ncbi:palmitoleoyl-protein carboxylesterase NOTUM [Anopheles ziemanni]|uniref:palmitoleoyl-protein carboxylesterase NOTUM n=1 Tax=Anopheles coustani TaxID=139045 RepID=UPI00265A7C50|nr:palmitoleoyl-protein carboxylesterase NOTUM [Anopheles coustani]XP_058178138.1 palmitoleoyl-protein carboxylesterase NOTUM [Anopheles ziemanni]
MEVTVIILLMVHSLPSVRCRSANVNSPNHPHSRHHRANISIESNSIQRLDASGGGRMASAGNGGASSSQPLLKRVFLSNRTVTCNDGSQAGFYLRKSPGSRRWVVFFEGGWHCFDHKSCRTRWLKQRHLMTSVQWPETRDVGGLLSPMPSENPYWYNANHVFVPYCSSDSWSGTKIRPDTRDGLRFMGSLIVRQVMSDLVPLGLGHSQGADLLMAGSSAGGLGVMLNLDKVRTFLQNERGLKVSVRGVSDSGWFLDREPYTPGAVAASEAVRQGWKMWDGALPQACVAEHSKEPWRCYFGHRLYNTLKSPLFVFQWLFDEAQMRADSVGAPVTPQQWNYIHDMGGALRESLNNVSAVFAPSCIGHSVLTKRDWMKLKIDDISLADALRCWEQSNADERQSQWRSVNRSPQKLHRKHNPQGGRRKNKQQQQQQQQQQRKQLQTTTGSVGTEQTSDRPPRPKLTKEERERRRQERRKRQNLKKPNGTDPSGPADSTGSTKVPKLDRSPKNSSTSTPIPANGNQPVGHNNQPKRHNQRHHPGQTKKQQQQPDVSRTPATTVATNEQSPPHKLRNQNKKRQNAHRNRNRKARGGNGGGGRNRAPQALNIPEPKKCSLRLLERCSWPQCNHSCPTLTNPLTGEEMKFLELLASFGLDMDAVATALGVDMQTLNNMDRAELVNLLTQQVT